MKIIFTIPTLFCNPKQTIGCVDSLLNSLANTTHDYDIWVITNTENQEFNDWNPPKGVNKDCSNLEFSIAKALNLGISKKTDHDYFCYIDEGMICESGWLDSVYEIYNKYDNVGMIGNRPHRIFKDYNIKLEDGVYEVLWSDGIIFAKFDRIESVDGFDESYFGDGETQDFCYRLMDEGYRNLYLSSEIFEIQHHTTDWAAKSYNVDELMIKSANSRKLCEERWGEWRKSKLMKNVVFMTCMVDAPDTLDYSKWCFKSWTLWCEKNNVELFVLEDELLPKGDGTYRVPGMKPTWQRWHVFEVLDENDISYNQVALVDVDTMIHPDAPNFFDETKGEFSGVNDDLMVEWVHNSINGYQDMFPDVNFDWTSYFNCGFIVLSKKHKELCKSITDFYYSNEDELRKRQHETLKKGSDQTPINYLVRREGYKITHLSKKWNFTHLHNRGVLPEALFLDCAWVYHFNGFDKSLRNNLMKQTWEEINNRIIND